MRCVCPDGRHPVGTALWHRAYCRWLDHSRAGHGVRAALWGWAADRLVSVA